MTSKRLQELKEEIERLESEKAARGAETPEQSGSDWLLGIAAAALGLGLIVGLVVFLNYESPAKKQARLDAREQAERVDRARMATPANQSRLAVGACRQFVSRRLLDPDAARWIENAQASEDLGIWTVTGSVIAKNRMNGFTENTYNCRIIKVDEDWAELSVTFGG